VGSPDHYPIREARPDRPASPAAPAGNLDTGRLRRRRYPLPLDQAGRLSRRGRRDGGASFARVPGHRRRGDRHILLL